MFRRVKQQVDYWNDFSWIAFDQMLDVMAYIKVVYFCPFIRLLETITTGHFLHVQ